MNSIPSAWECTDERYSLICGIVTTSPETIEAWRDGRIKFEPLFRAYKGDPYARDVADWCQRSLDDARKSGRLETRPFVQNAEMIIAALRTYGNKPTVVKLNSHGGGTGVNDYEMSDGSVETLAPHEAERRGRATFRNRISLQ